MKKFLLLLALALLSSFGANILGQCQLGALPSLTFSKTSTKLTDISKQVLSAVAADLRNNPQCIIAVIGYCSNSKGDQQRSWDYVNWVINYLVEKEGISQDRFIFRYGEEGGDCNTVDLKVAEPGQDGPKQGDVPPPFPETSAISIKDLQKTDPKKNNTKKIDPKKNTIPKKPVLKKPKQKPATH